MGRERCQELPKGQRHKSPDIEPCTDIRGWWYLQQGQSRSHQSEESQVMCHTESQWVWEHHEDSLAQDIVAGAESVPGYAQAGNLERLSGQ